MLSPVPNLFLFRKVLIKEHLGEWGGKGSPRAEVVEEVVEERITYSEGIAAVILLLSNTDIFHILIYV